MGSFIDNRVWALAGYPAGKTVPVEIFEDREDPGKYRIPNPYATAAKAFGREVEVEGEFLSFSYTRSYVSFDTVDTGLFVGGEAIGISSDMDGLTYNHIISSFADGKPAVIQLAPKYGDESFESRKEEYHAIKNEPSENGALMIAFPGAEVLPFISVSDDCVSVSADQMKTNRYKPTDDGWGPMGLVDDNTSTFWHTPYAYVDTNPSPVYGQYVDFALPAAVSSFYFNYCTRESYVQAGAPAQIVIGGSNNGKKFTVLAEFSYEQLSKTSYGQWIGLPMVSSKKKYKYLRFGIVQNQKGEDMRVVASQPDEKWVNLAELHIYGK